MSKERLHIGFPSSQVVLILMGILVLYLAVDFGRQVIVSQQRRDDLRVVQAQIVAGEQRHGALEGELAFSQSDAAVEAWAREQGWVKANEVPVVIVAPNAQAVPASTEGKDDSRAGTVPKEWWDLFFGNR